MAQLNNRLRRTLSRPFALTALTLVLVTFSAAQDADSAWAFLNSAVRLYQNGGKGVEYSTRYYHSSLLALIRADMRAAKQGQDGIPLAGSDVFCNCQEWDGFWVLRMNIKLQPTGRAEAFVSFTLHAPKNGTNGDVRRNKYVLVPERGEWRIYDVQYLSGQNGVKSLRKALSKDIELLRRPQ